MRSQSRTPVQIFLPTYPTFRVVSLPAQRSKRSSERSVKPSSFISMDCARTAHRFFRLRAPFATLTSRPNPVNKDAHRRALGHAVVPGYLTRWAPRWIWVRPSA